MAGLDRAISSPILVTPAKAGVQLASVGESKLDSGFRRN